MPDRMRTDTTAVVLAGGSPAEPLAAWAGVATKALVPFEGRPLAAYVLEALRESRRVHHIVYVGPTTPCVEQLCDDQVPSGERLVDSLAMGLGAALALARPGMGRLLILTADLPWLTAAGIDRFVDDAPAADFVFPVVPKAVSKQHFPEQTRTYVRLDATLYTGGNLLLLQAEAAPRLLPFVDRAYRARKNPVALSTIVGVRMLVRFLLGVASLSEVERRVSALLDAEVRVLVTGDASLAADVDSPTHLHPESVVT
ncbi:MAG: NTP transferase domain-containing protein [Trueperaceae bacterium]|nr:MAG: NTP transferase domain-containing protein [Trueperaceae bacterium]